jgi:hypothetical protein
MAGTIVSDTLQSSVAGPPVFQNNSGTEAGRLCRAWVNFNGSTSAISASFNVSSVVRNGTGDYTINFTNSMPDDNYSVVGSAGNAASSSRLIFVLLPNRTSSAARVSTVNESAGGLSDAADISSAIFR